MDNNAVKATFLDNTVSFISSVTIGPVTAADRGNLTGLLNRNATGLLPAGTRLIEIDVVVKWSQGYNSGVLDNISLVLNGVGTLFLPLMSR